ncbi:hypothetical protein F3087_19595 [Nocardia colli]|uniref:Uncharacterized protein n=1 Tax=Nocardia colli TaxID=2545717 RepID=A0A5N0EDW8_9NOCA|nr:hypothetical protein [Nocardia colli]KAA8887116.1 hypothetical protein F3087_19595 [Nocardia colli]
MFHKTATVAVTGLLAVAATLAVAAGAAHAAPSSSETAPTQQVDATGSDAQDTDLFGVVTPKSDKKAEKGKKEKSAEEAPKEPTAADKEAAAALNSALRDFLRPPHGGAEMGPLGKTSDEWLDLFLGPQPGAESTPKAKPIR